MSKSRNENDEGLPPDREYRRDDTGSSRSQREIIEPNAESPDQMPVPPRRSGQNRPSTSDLIDKKIIKHSLKIQDEKWIKSYWRPAMAWLYMLICFTDFVLFPALALILPAVLAKAGIPVEYDRWESLTLTNGGIIHVAFGTILGIAAWSRGKEKINGIS